MIKSLVGEENPDVTEMFLKENILMEEPENKIPGKTKCLELDKVHLKALLTSYGKGFDKFKVIFFQESKPSSLPLCILSLGVILLIPIPVITLY